MALITEDRVGAGDAWRDADCDVAIVGAGPYALATAIRLRRAGVDTRVFGDCMAFWRSMPKGMLLRSNWSASNILSPTGEHSLDAFKADTGAAFEQPVPLEQFIAYGQWIQRRAVPDLDPRLVGRVERAGGGFSLTLAGGDVVRARRTVIACGIAPFAWRPPEFDGLPAELATHASEHDDLAVFAGRRVAVVGGGQSALESAALLHEGGADVTVHVRAERIVWLRGHAVIHRIGRLGPVVYAPTDVGPMWYSRLNSQPDAFRRLPREAQTRIARRSIRPAGSHWVRQRLQDVPLRLGTSLTAAAPSGDGLDLRFSDGSGRQVDHLIFGTGYRVDVARYPFLTADTVAALERRNGYPVLQRGLESSVPGLHFLGAPASWSFGPVMRFVSGSWYASRAVAAALGARGAGVRRAA